MNPKKSGTVFIVFMIALIAFGTASAANVANLGTDLFDGLTIPTSLNTQQQITDNRGSIIQTSLHYKARDLKCDQ